MSNVVFRKPPRVLFFIKDGSPTDDEIKAASALGGGCVFRNATYAQTSGAIEEADAVAGEANDYFKERLPYVTSEAEAIDARAKRLQAVEEAATVGEIAEGQSALAASQAATDAKPAKAKSVKWSKGA